jgi:hypothetical protein
MNVVAEIPKQELLIKMMGMTTSDNDGQALVALRKANKLLADNGWSWEKLIQGKVKVVENPFANAANPFGDRDRVVQRQGPIPTPRPDPVFRPAPAAPKPSAPKSYWATTANPLSTVRNRFPDHCYGCGLEQLPGKGWLFDPWNFVPTAQSKWRVVCDSCNNGGRAIYSRPEPPIKGKKPSVSDLA